MKPTDDNWWSWSQVCRALIRPKQIRSDITPHSFCPSPTRARTTTTLWGLSLIKNRNFHLKEKKKSKHVFTSSVLTCFLAQLLLPLFQESVIGSVSCARQVQHRVPKNWQEPDVNQPGGLSQSEPRLGTGRKSKLYR